MEVFGSSGTRGVTNEELTPAFVADLASAVGTVWDAERVAVARDTRVSGPMFEAAVASGLAAVGAGVDRLGILPTPALQAYCDWEAVPGIAVTASHNPPEYNGLKLVEAGGVEPSVEALEAIERVHRERELDRRPWASVGDIRPVDGADRRYVDSVLEAVDRDRIAAAGLTVALDPGHGAGATTSPELFRRLGCRVVTVNADPDGRFPGRDPEPVYEHLNELCRLVRAADADLGIAHDGDADRAIFVDERGEYIEGDASLAALAAAELEAGDATVSAVNASQRLVDVANAADATLELTPVGSTRIMSRIRELEADGVSVPVAGEGNGGVIFPPYRLARDGAYTAARFLELLCDRSASALIAPHDDYHNERRNVGYDSESDRRAAMDTVAAHAESADAEVTTIDGYRFGYDNGWVLVRPSGTEPLIRIYAEADSADRAGALADRLSDVLRGA